MKKRWKGCVVPMLSPSLLVWRWVVAILVIAMTGCSNSSSPQTVTKSEEKSSESAEHTHPETATVTPSNSARSPQAELLDGAEVSADSVAIDLDALQATTEMPPLTAVAPSPPTKALEPLPPPSQEQLARWGIAPREQLQLLACYDPDKIGFVSQLAYPPDGRYFILGGTKLTLWKPTADAPEHVFLDLANESDRSIKSMAISADGKWFCAGDTAGQLYAWNVEDRKQLVTKSLYSNDVVQIAISPSGGEIATMTYGQEVTIWETQQWGKKNSFNVDTRGVERILYIADQKLAAAGETTSLWNTATGELEKQLSPGRYQFALAPSLDRKQFAVGQEEGLRFWDVAELTPTSLVEGDFRGSQLAFSSDQQLLASCAGKDIYVRDIPKNQIVQIIEATGPAIVGLAWLPESRLLVSVSELGRIRVWGDQAAARTAKLQPLHGPIEMPKPGSTTPATPAQLQAAIELVTLPRLPGAKVSLSMDTMISYTASSSIEEAKAFYHYLLPKLGWVSTPGNPHTPDYLNFARDSFRLFISLSKMDDDVQVSLTNLGNCDTRTLPKFDGGTIEVTYQDESSSSYTTEGDLLTIETNLLRQMQQAGWTAYARLNSSHNAEPDVRDLEFYQNSIIIRVSIRKFPATPDRYTVQYTTFLGTSSLPVPDDVDFVEADVVTGEPRLVASTSLKIDAAREFYDRAMVAQGWLPRERGRAFKKEFNWLNYIRGQRDLTIGLSATEDGRTLVRVGDSLESLSWQLKQPTTPSEEATSTVEKPQTGIEAADFPMLAGTNSIEANSQRQELAFKIEPASLLDIAEQYLAQMAKLGWQPTREGIKSAEYVFLTFGKNKAEINLRANVRSNVASISIEGDGLLWNKPLAIVPKLISYEAWLRNNRHPATLDLLEIYEKEMRPLVAGTK